MNDIQQSAELNISHDFIVNDMKIVNRTEYTLDLLSGQHRSVFM